MPWKVTGRNQHCRRQQREKRKSTSPGHGQSASKAPKGQAREFIEGAPHCRIAPSKQYRCQCRRRQLDIENALGNCQGSPASWVYRFFVRGNGLVLTSAQK